MTDSLVQLAQEYVNTVAQLESIRAQMVRLLANGADPAPTEPTVRPTPPSVKTGGKSSKRAKAHPTKARPRVEVMQEAKAAERGYDCVHQGPAGRHERGCPAIHRAEGDDDARTPQAVEQAGSGREERRGLGRRRVGLTEEERALIEPCSRPASTRWILPLAAFERKTTHEHGGARYG
jgi:hypothetical protein